MARGRRISRLKLIDLSDEVRQKYLLEWNAKLLREEIHQLPKLTSEALFDNAEAPLEVEIGPGSGEYLTGMAESRPAINFLGIEASKKGAYYAVDSAARKALENFRLIKTNFLLLSALMPKASWQKVYLHFPDPVHKRKDEKHRIFTQAFLDQMANVLVPDGRISVVSDEADFFAEMRAVAASHSAFRFEHPQKDWIEFNPEHKSRFQEFWEKKGVRPRRFVLAKSAIN